MHEHGSAPRLHSSAPVDAARAACRGGRARAVRGARDHGCPVRPHRLREGRGPGGLAGAWLRPPWEIRGRIAGTQGHGCSGGKRHRHRHRHHGSSAEARARQRPAEARHRGGPARLQRRGHAAPAAHDRRDRPPGHIPGHVPPLPEPPPHRRTATATGDAAASAGFGPLSGHAAACDGCLATGGGCACSTTPVDRPARSQAEPGGGRRPTASRERARGAHKKHRPDGCPAASRERAEVGHEECPGDGCSAAPCGRAPRAGGEWRQPVYAASSRHRAEGGDQLLPGAAWPSYARPAVRIAAAGCFGAPAGHRGARRRVVAVRAEWRGTADEAAHAAPAEHLAPCRRTAYRSTRRDPVGDHDPAPARPRRTARGVKYATARRRSVQPGDTTLPRHFRLPRPFRTRRRSLGPDGGRSQPPSLRLTRTP